MSNNLIPNPKAPNDSTDYIYGERMEPYEDRMNFFLNKKVDVNKDKVKDEDKATVDGLESIVQRFTDFGRVSLPVGLDIPLETSVDGLEAAGNIKKFVDILVQFAKDAVEFIMNLINNRISRVDNRAFKLKINRKRDGIISDNVKYPVGVRRLILPLKLTTDPTWVSVSLGEVNDFYDLTIKAYKGLVDDIPKVTEPSFSLAGAMADSIEKAAKLMKMSRKGETWSTEILPGNKFFMIEDIQDGDTDAIRLYFQMANTDAKLRSAEFDPSSYMMDATLSVINKTISNIRSNQSTISQLYRNFEKTVKRFENNSELKLDVQQRQYLNWLVRFNKKLMNVSIQYVLNGLDTGLDFAAAGIRK